MTQYEQTYASWASALDLNVGAVEAGEMGWTVAINSLAASLSYHDGLRRERSPANLIQAFRDEFGAHGYRRVDHEGEHHTDWCGTGTEPQ